jgi:hypothetical protein
MQVLRTICLKCRLFLEILHAMSEIIGRRWRGSVLYFTSPCNGRSSTSICPSLPLHSEPTSTRDWFLGHPSSRAEPIPFQRTSKCTGSRPHRRASRLGQLWQNLHPAGGFPTSTLGRGLRHGSRIPLGIKLLSQTRKEPVHSSLFSWAVTADHHLVHFRPSSSLHPNRRSYSNTTRRSLRTRRGIQEQHSSSRRGGREVWRGYRREWGCRSHGQQLVQLA